MELQERLYKLPDTQLFVQRAGESDRVLLFIHGFLASTFTWRYMFPLLSPHFTVYAVDLPGFGRSDKCKRYPYTLAAYAQSIHDFIQGEGIEKLTLVAHSMGGQVALRIATLAPETVERLVLIAPSGYLPTAKRWQKAFFRIPFAYKIVPLMLTQKRIHQQLSNVYYNLNIIDNDDIYNGYITPLMDRSFHRALFQFARSRESDLTAEELQRIKQPTLLLWGSHDRIVPLRTGERLMQDLPNATMEVIEETGHLPIEENPQDVLTRMLGFLDLER